MLEHKFPFDTVQMPLNCFDASFRSFETQVLPEVTRRGMAALVSIPVENSPLYRSKIPHPCTS
jgi:aryl-alcohol dehydrogenase-like predicted oxidoreductase